MTVESTGSRAVSASVLPVAPLLYVAWADGELEAEELALVRRRLEELPPLERGGRREVEGWLDPASPPTAVELQRLLRSVRRGCADAGADTGARRSLTELVEALGARVSDEWSAEATRRAVREVEEALGIAGDEMVAEILRPARPLSAEDARQAPSPLARALQSALDGEHAELKERLRSLLSQERFAYRLELPRDEYRDLVLDWCRELAAEGFGGLAFPEDCGGAGDMAAFMAAFETLACHDLSLLVKFGVQFGLWGGSVLSLGDESFHRRYLPPTGTLELPGCFAMTETGHGSNVREIETVARFDPEHGDFLLHTPNDAARKDYIGNAARHGRIATVFAQLEIPLAGGSDEEGEGEIEEHGVHAFVVPLRDEEGETLPGIRIEDCGPKVGLDGVDNGRIWFDQVRVPRQNLLNRFAEVDEDGGYHSPIASPSKRFFTMLGTLVGGRVSVAAAGLSAAKSGLAIATRYALRRRQFGAAGEPETLLMDYPSHQRRLLPHVATNYAAHFAVAAIRRRYLAATDDTLRGVEHEAAGIKVFCTEHAVAALQECREACGGAGYLSENRLGALRADSDVFVTFEGDNTVLLQLLAKGLLTGFRERFAEDRFRSMLRYLGSRALVALREKNPVTKRLAGSDHLRDPGVQRAAFRYRAETLLGSVAQRLQGRLKGGASPQEALLACQSHLLSAARAHVVALVFEEFDATVAAAEADGETEGAGAALAEVLRSLCSLFALRHLEKDRGWFLERDYIEGVKARGIRREVEALCAELRPRARDLVDGFGIPDALLAAPIAT